MERWLERFARAAFLRSGDTAHDLKTPLNVAVLNLELLRMRVRKLTEKDDAKLDSYAASIETELRRMAQIFDSYFLLSIPPAGHDAPAPLDAATLCAEEAAKAGYAVSAMSRAMVVGHETRIRQAFKLFFGGASKVLKADRRKVTTAAGDGVLTVTVSGHPEGTDLDVAKIFKFYYTDPLGKPDLSLAVARLIAETYGGELNASEESDKVILRLSLPLGEE